jgi:hypothetical protein
MEGPGRERKRWFVWLGLACGVEWSGVEMRGEEEMGRGEAQRGRDGGDVLYDGYGRIGYGDESQHSKPPILPTTLRDYETEKSYTYT